MMDRRGFVAGLLAFLIPKVDPKSGVNLKLCRPIVIDGPFRIVRSGKIRISSKHFVTATLLGYEVN